MHVQVAVSVRAGKRGDGVQLPGLNWGGRSGEMGIRYGGEKEEPGGRFVAFTLYMKEDKNIQSICTTKIQQYIQKGCSGERSLSLGVGGLPSGSAEPSFPGPRRPVLPPIPRSVFPARLREAVRLCAGVCGCVRVRGLFAGETVVSSEPQPIAF